MGLTTIQDFVVDTLIEKQSITKEKLSNALDQILSSEGINKFLGLLIQEKPVDKKLNKGYGISLISIESDWNSKAKAIKFIRDKFGIGLKGAKDLVDATLERQVLGIEGYFSWARSPEGHTYWNNLYNEFCTNEYT